MARKTENQLATLNEGMKDLSTNMRCFSLSMRSLYAEKTVSSESNVAIKFIQLRDDTRKDAMVYVKAILPVSTSLVRSLNEFFEYYIELDYDDWCANLEDIIEDVRSYKDCCTEVVKLHEDVMVPLKQKEDQAKVLVAEFQNLAVEYEKQKKEFEDSSSSKMGWAWALAFVPVVNLISTPLLLKGANKDTANAIAKGTQLGINEAATLTVSEVMVPALKSFIDGLSAAAGFFNVVENELTMFQGKAEKANENMKKLHYTMISKKAKEIKGHCQSFYAMIPQVRTDFDAIPFEDTDKNYVDDWLEKKKEEINNKYRLNLTGSIRKMISMMSDVKSVPKNVSQSDVGSVVTS